MKKVYESPKMVAEVFKASQAVAGNCLPKGAGGGFDEDVDTLTNMKCDSTSSTHKNLTHNDIVGGVPSTTVFSDKNSACVSKVSATDASTIKVQWQRSDWTTHSVTIQNPMTNGKPYYFYS